jgi:hypothetical protein
MAEKVYIDQELLLKSKQWNALQSYDSAMAKAIVLGQPAANVVEVSNGKFFEDKDGKRDANYTCSECGTMGSPQWKCCPVCTALMFDGGVSDG